MASNGNVPPGDTDALGSKPSGNSAPGLRRGRLALLVGLPVVAGVAGFTFAVTAGQSAPQPGDPVAAADTAAAEATTPPAGPITLSATGDVIMGSEPNMLPANGGAGFFDSVAGELQSDLVMGNLEQTLTPDTGISKCGGDTSACFAFRLPPEYAANLAATGFDVMTIANNHTYDFGEAGYVNTKKALTDNGIEPTGDPGVITIKDVDGVKVAVVGFSPYPMHNQVTNIAAGQALVRKASEQADVVVVQAQMGAEGADQVNTPYGNEIFYGEDRGDVRTFSRAMIDAGADLIVGHSPHVLRGMEFYQGRLIAYSLGNFAGGGNTLSNTGPLGLGGILKVTLNPDGSWVSGQFVSTYMDDAGVPTVDPGQSSVALLSELNATDFPGTAVSYGPDGTIQTP